MSVISAIHTVVPFVAGTTKAQNGQRLSKVGYKTTKKVKAKFPSIAVSVPKMEVSQWTEENIVERIAPHINAYLESVQDKVVRSLYESSGGKLTEVSDSDIGMESVIQYLEAEANGSRMTKESVEKWFDMNLSENLFTAIASKMGIENDPDDTQSAQIQNLVNGYRGMYSALSGGATMYARDKVDQLIRALEFSAENESGIDEKLNARLEAMKMEKKEISLMDL